MWEERIFIWFKIGFDKFIQKSLRHLIKNWSKVFQPKISKIFDQKLIKFFFYQNLFRKGSWTNIWSKHGSRCWPKLSWLSVLNNPMQCLSTLLEWKRHPTRWRKVLWILSVVLEAREWRCVFIWFKIGFDKFIQKSLRHLIKNWSKILILKFKA